MIYLDHAATSWPKPTCVSRAMVEFLERSGGNPGRSGHRLSVEAGRIVFETREKLARFFNAPHVRKVIFTPNATAALNLVIHGLLRPGDRVVATQFEHNSVLRPLRFHAERGVKLDFIETTPDFQPSLPSLLTLLEGSPRPRTPGMAAGLTDHIWSLKEWCTYPVYPLLI